MVRVFYVAYWYGSPKSRETGFLETGFSDPETRAARWTSSNMGVSNVVVRSCEAVIRGVVYARYRHGSGVEIMILAVLAGTFNSIRLSHRAEALAFAVFVATLVIAGLFFIAAMIRDVAGKVD